MRTLVMQSIPPTEEALSPRPDSVSLTPGTSKSKIRSLFQWRKSDNGSLRPNTRSGAEAIPHRSLPVEQTLRPPLSSRARSDNTLSSSRPTSADNKAVRKRDRLLADPPPLAQAYGQAILHANLEAPTSFTEKPSGRRESNTLKDPSSRDLSEDRIEVKRSHKKTDSAESSCSTSGKIFFLVNGPYVLQYHDDSNGDALPEKILVLDQDSIAFASDVVPGRPYVLQISKPQINTNKNQAQTLRPSWSRLTLRQPEERRSVNTLLLVFKDSEELYTWLFAMRKEIENLGGLEYKPDADDDRTWRDDLTRTYNPKPNSKSNSRTSSATRAPSHRTSPQSASKVRRVGAASRTRSHSDESTASSKKTSTSLDRLRDSVASDGYSSTLATSCAEGSVPATSPICESFPSIKSVTEHAKGDLSLRIYNRYGEVTPALSKSPSSRSLLERRKLSVNSLHLANGDPSSGNSNNNNRIRGNLLDLPSPISASPLDSLPQLTSPISITTTSVDGGSEGSPDRKDVKTPGDRRKSKERPASSLRKHVSQKASIAESSNSVPRAKYSLFPVCPPAEAKEEPLASPTAMMPTPTKSNLKLRDNPVTPVIRVNDDRPQHKKSRSRTVTLELRQHRVSALLGTGEFDQPQRSPAVTDEMIMLNFGIARNEPPPSPMPESRVPGLNDLKIDLDFLKAPYRAPSKSQGSSSVTRRPSSTRSASSSRVEVLATATKAPIGPPPAGPLPAVPMDSKRTSRTNRSSQQSQKSVTRKEDQAMNTEIPQTIVARSSTACSVRSTKDDFRSISGEHKDDHMEQQPRNRSRSRSRGRRRSVKKN